MSRKKFKEYYYYNIIGFACVLYAILQLFPLDEKIEASDYAKIKGHIAKPIKYNKKERRRRDPSFNITLKEYPAFGFELMERSLIRKDHTTIENFKYTTKNELGKLVTLIISKENAEILHKDSLNDYNTPRFWEKGWIHIYGLQDEKHVYATFSVQDDNKSLKANKEGMLILFSCMGVICFLAARYKKRKKISFDTLKLP